MWFLLFLNLCCVVFLFFCLFDSGCLLSFWFVAELLSLSVVPHFFYWSSCNSQRYVLQYVLALLISSLFLVVGVISVEYQSVLIFVGVLIKLGIYPFMSWVYEVIIFSSWVSVWVFSSLLKIPFFLLFYVGSSGLLIGLCSVLCVISLIILLLNFWKVSSSWRYCWCHMMLSGSVVLAVVSMSCPFSNTILLYLVYLVWSTLVLWYLSVYGSLAGEWLVGFGGVLYLFLLVTFPVSLAVIYKLVLGAFVLFSSFPVFAIWCCYTISEQLFLVYFLIGGVSVRSNISLLSSV